MRPTIGRIVLYRTDGRNGLVYDLPAIVTCTQDTHPGGYPDGSVNPLPVPEGDAVHLTVFTPGGFGSKVATSGNESYGEPETDDEYVGAAHLQPGSGTYVEWSVPFTDAAGESIPARSWRWPERV